MGFFSWITQDTKRSIPNVHCGKKTFTVYMHDDKGNIWEEKEYDGYGVFGGKDFYVLLAEMNGLTAKSRDKLRSMGIDLVYGIKPYISPNLTQYKVWNWKNRPPENCPNQGFFYFDKDEDDN
jgi:hypothetical protein